MQYGRKWEIVNADTYRLETPLGWLVVCESANGQAMAFVPDKDKNWLLKESEN